MSAVIRITWDLYPRLPNKRNAINLYFTIRQYRTYSDILFTIPFTVHFMDCTIENSDSFTESFYFVPYLLNIVTSEFFSAVFLYLYSNS